MKRNPTYATYRDEGLVASGKKLVARDKGRVARNEKNAQRVLFLLATYPWPLATVIKKAPKKGLF